jgi:hypothetical protein
MRVNELLESVTSSLEKELDQANEEKLDYDLVEDLVFFMNHNDDAYRRHTFPAVTKCLERIKSNQKTHPSIFKIAVLKGFKDYSTEFPDRLLPTTLDEKVCEEACKKMHEETCKYAEEGKYKD